MKGQCLCGTVGFELEGRLPDLYQCHCSLCRKVTGSAANAALRIPADQFAWIRGEEEIRRYQTDSGFKSHFCAVCGSPLPNPNDTGGAWWIPAGLLEDQGELKLAAHLFVASKASWDLVADGPRHFDEMPDAENLQYLLGSGEQAVTEDDVLYRDMRAVDYEAMIRLWQNCDGLLLRDADSRDGIEKYLRRNPGLSFVALDGEKELIGTIMAGHEGRRGYILHVAVDPAMRRRGVASRLVELSLDALKRAGIVKAHVHVAASNRPGRDYWERRGFHHRGEIELYSFVNGENENA